MSHMVNYSKLQWLSKLPLIKRKCKLRETGQRVPVVSLWQCYQSRGLSRWRVACLRSPSVGNRRGDSITTEAHTPSSPCRIRHNLIVEITVLYFFSSVILTWDSWSLNNSNRWLTMLLPTKNHIQFIPCFECELPVLVDFFAECLFVFMQIQNKPWISIVQRE